MQTPEQHAAKRREFKVGDRVRINYGPCTVVQFTPARGDIEGCVVVHADVGQAWFRRPEDVEPMELFEWNDDEADWDHA